MDLEKAEQIVNKNRNKKLTENQIKEVIALAELLASCTIINLKNEMKVCFDYKHKLQQSREKSKQIISMIEIGRAHV